MAELTTIARPYAEAAFRIARDTNALLIIPNAGADEITGPLCAANIFRTSFSNSQMGIAMGKVMAEQKKKTAVTLTWKYAAGDESVGGFKETFEAGGGKVIKELSLPFPQVEFQSYLTEIAAFKPDVVYVFFAGGGAVKFVKDYAAAGLGKTIPLVGAGFLTDGTLANGSRDIEPPSCMNTWVSIDWREDVMTFHPFGLPYTIVTREMQGNQLVWHYPRFGEVRMERICEVPEAFRRSTEADSQS